MKSDGFIPGLDDTFYKEQVQIMQKPFKTFTQKLLHISNEGVSNSTKNLPEYSNILVS